MQETLQCTDKQFWTRYWSRFQASDSHDLPFMDVLVPILPKGGRLIEIGGFPGRYSAHLARSLQCDVTLLDFHVAPETIRAVEDVNSLPPGTIHVLEADFLQFRSAKKYDVVFSAGFIEHFQDTRDILRRHYDLLAEGGTLFIAMPNFRGLNGLVQRVLDPVNFRAHNTDAMNIRLLRKYCRELGRQPQIFYYGRPECWLEGTARGGRLARRFVSRMSNAMKRIHGKNRILSPYIVILDAPQAS